SRRRRPGRFRPGPEGLNEAGNSAARQRPRGAWAGGHSRQTTGDPNMRTRYPFAVAMVAALVGVGGLAAQDAVALADDPDPVSGETVKAGEEASRVETAPAIRLQNYRPN